jgi:hypothetical protein
VSAQLPLRVTRALRESPGQLRGLLLLTTALFLAYFLVQGESAKWIVRALTFFAAVVSGIVCTGQIFVVAKYRLLAGGVLVFALASFALQRELFFLDTERTQIEAEALTCAEARKILATGEGLGRTWQVGVSGTPMVRGRAPMAWRSAGLFLYRSDRDDGTEAYSLIAGSWTSDLVPGFGVRCGPGAREKQASTP